jgi:Alpha 1,4-glycosyltransferase conserved region
LRITEIVRGKVDLSRLPWGSTGPLALSALARRFEVSSQALAPEVFYPVSWREAGWIVDPGARIEDKVTDRTIAVHLWNECIKAYKNAPAPDGSFLNRLHDEGRD